MSKITQLQNDLELLSQSTLEVDQTLRSLRRRLKLLGCDVERIADLIHLVLLGEDIIGKVIVDDESGAAVFTLKSYSKSHWVR